MRFSRPARLAAAALALACSVVAAVPAHAQAATEYAAKAAFIYNVALFSSLPGATGTVRVCVLGRDPFGAALDSLEGKALGEAKMAVARLQSDGAALKQCQILFISASEADNLGALAESARDAGILTVSDTKGAARLGVMLELYLDDKRIAFDCNATAARAAGIVLSSKLLRLARAVH